MIYTENRLNIALRGINNNIFSSYSACVKTTVSLDCSVCLAGLGAAAPPPYSALFRLPGHSAAD